MGKQEYVSPEGLRQDGRRPMELRAMHGQMDVFPRADGSATFSFGNTKVIASVYGPQEARLRRDQQHDRATINVRFHAAAFSSSGGERRRTGRTDRKLEEWSRFVTDALENVILTKTYPRTQIDILVEVVNADGSVLMASINAITLALINASVPMQDYLIATSAIHFAGQRAANGMTVGSATVIDPNRLEEVSGAPIIRAMMLGRSMHVIAFSVERRLPMDLLESTLEAIKSAGRKIFDHLDNQVVRPHSLRVLGARIVKATSESSLVDRILGKDVERG